MKIKQLDDFLSSTEFSFLGNMLGWVCKKDEEIILRAGLNAMFLDLGEATLCELVITEESNVYLEIDSEYRNYAQTIADLVVSLFSTDEQPFSRCEVSVTEKRVGVSKST